jgi:DNA invertase Pin-like site-specific DNA recombinase
VHSSCGDILMATTALVPAAQYLRMSTEHQRYSIENQSTLIRRYADGHGLSILQTYSDAAKSGLVLSNRSGLRQLLQDVVSKPSFKVILVYDVSRWGRFQDADESAHYEFICKSAGVPVHYCAESFVNDGSLPSLIMKSLKRMMAGEYSRELSAKVYEGSKHISQLGFKVGGTAGYGLRRMLVSGERQHKQELTHGQRKNIKEDRVILVPGPEEEVDCVREIFRMYTEEQRLPSAIARELNHRGVQYTGGSKRTQWYSGCVSRILENPKYAGYNVYGRRSQKLRTPNITMPKALWIVTPGAWTPVVDRSTFEKAQQRTQNQTCFKSDDRLLADLRQLLVTKGLLSAKLLKASHFPSLQTYRGRFGSLSEAFSRIDYTGGRISRILTRRNRSAMRDELICQIVAAANNKVSVVRRNKHYRPKLQLRNRTLVSVYVCPSFMMGNGELRWQLDRAHREPNHITLLARLNRTNDDFQDFHLIPRSRTRTRWTMKLDDAWLKKGRRLISPTDFVETVRFVQRRRGNATLA